MESNLEHIYTNQIKPRGTIRMGSAGSSSFGATYERDPHFKQLENSVFSKINELTKDHEELITKKPEYRENNLTTVSVEDAIKELLELEKLNAE